MSPKKIDDIKVEDSLEYYICEICKNVYLFRDLSSFSLEVPFLGKCISCTAEENESRKKREEDEVKKKRIDRLQDMSKYLDENK